MIIAFLDTETVTLALAPRVIWEVGLIVRHQDGDREFRWQLRPDMSQAHPKSLEICGFAERFCVPEGHDACGWYPDGSQKVLKRHTALQQIVIQLMGAHVYGVVPSFDAARLTLDLAEIDHVPSWHYQLHDVEDLAAGFSRGRQCFSEYRYTPPIGLTPPYDSDVLAEELGLTAPGPGVVHTALGDARHARALYDAVMA